MAFNLRLTADSSLNPCLSNCCMSFSEEYEYNDILPFVNRDTKLFQLLNNLSSSILDAKLLSIVGAECKKKLNNLVNLISSISNGAILFSLISLIVIKNPPLINNNLEQQAQAIFKSWFVDFDPFGGNRPIDWITGIVDDLGAEIICGKTPSTKKKEYYGGNTPFITIPDMHGCVYNVSTERYLSAAGVASQPKKTLPHNTVCISCIGTAGLVTLVSEKSQSNQQINSIVPKEGISAYYIYLLMQTLSETINKLGQSGSTIVNLNKTQFGKIPVPIPSEQVLCNFDTLCKPLFEMILSNQKENIKLANLRDTLLPKLMAGELDVSDLDL